MKIRYPSCTLRNFSLTVLKIWKTRLLIAS
jgi:hypothetical protein